MFASGRKWRELQINSDSRKSASHKNLLSSCWVGLGLQKRNDVMYERLIKKQLPTYAPNSKKNMKPIL